MPGELKTEHETTPGGSKSGSEPESKSDAADPDDVECPDGGVINLTEVRKWILSKCRVEDGHWVWAGKLVGDGYLPAVLLPYSCYTVHPSDGAKRLTTLPSKWMEVCRTKQLAPMGRQTRLAQDCDRKGCVLHFLRVTNHAKSVDDMQESDDFVLAWRRFEEYCGPKDEFGCVSWTGGKFPGGYGRFTFFGHVQMAHRVAWILANYKDIPKGMVVRHLCPRKNKLCVASDHLAIGTPAENSADEEKFRKVGEASPHAKITEEQAKRVIASFNDGRSPPERAKAIGVPVATVHRIDAARGWRHLMTPKQIAERSVRKHSQRLSDDIVRQIRESKGTGTLAERAEEFGTTSQTIRDIDNGKVYRGVLSDENEQARMEQKQIWDDAVERIKKNTTEHVTIDADGVRRVHLLWKGNMETKETGHRYLMSYRSDGKKQTYVHRAAWLAFNRKPSIPKDKYVLHRCQFKHCCSPKCLELGTKKQNAQDRTRDGTQPKGESHYQAKMSEATAKSIIASKGTLTMRERAEKFGTTISAVASIDSGKNWAHLRRDGAGSKRPQPPTATVSEEPPTKKRKASDD